MCLINGYRANAKKWHVCVQHIYIDGGSSDWGDDKIRLYRHTFADDVGWAMKMSLSPTFSERFPLIGATTRHAMQWWWWWLILLLFCALVPFAPTIFLSFSLSASRWLYVQAILYYIVHNHHHQQQQAWVECANTNDDDTVKPSSPPPSFPNPPPPPRPSQSQSHGSQWPASSVSQAVAPHRTAHTDRTCCWCRRS